MAKRKHAANLYAVQPTVKCARTAGTFHEDNVGSKAQSGSRLLQIPGEIRNCIYQFATEDDRLPVTLRPTDRPHSSTLDPALAAVPLHRRQFHALTRACHQIRHEFQPIYATRTEIWLHLEDVPRYIQAFFSSEDPAVRAKYLGNLFINSYTCEKVKNQGFDFLPLIKLLLEAPGIRCGINDTRKLNQNHSTDTTVLRLINNRDAAWLQLVDNAFESIRLHARPLAGPTLQRCRWCGGFHRALQPSPFIQLVLKKEHRKPWLDDGNMSSDRRRPLKKAFLVGIGLDDWPKNYVVKVAAAQRRSARLLEATPEVQTSEPEDDSDDDSSDDSDDE
ncbi:hypothetical protein BDV96DRAFT_642669 [Lophiotrema nucula]|uniref:F-box domain-containing protein n=1 Tax=Lophiotrema nucula TaxID=690887 RepID=A0A6A5ZJA9_9PLEO|nr:hypothetical protein BDV96DRAFT_642669 [Lophiotrema nucula]